MWVGWKVTITVIIHDVMLGLRPNGVCDRHLRRNIWARFLKICCQASMNGLNVGRMVKFKFINYKGVSNKQHLEVWELSCCVPKHSWTLTCSIFWRQSHCLSTYLSHWENCGIALWQNLRKPWIPEQWLLRKPHRSLWSRSPRKCQDSCRNP